MALLDLSPSLSCSVFPLQEKKRNATNADIYISPFSLLLTFSSLKLIWIFEALCNLENQVQSECYFIQAVHIILNKCIVYISMLKGKL